MNYKSERHKKRIEERDKKIEETNQLFSIRLSMRVHALKMKERARKYLEKYEQRGNQ